MGRQEPIFDYKGGECKDDFMIIMRKHFYYLKFCSFKYVLQCHAMQPEASIGWGIDFQHLSTGAVTDIS